ncbi:MAG: hypothetical protein CM1200mP14_23300 [Gammaproteobacteria bacterium]|nr:MAG: hypothetical protein CM1200mP14_23300 [Gammaproteobacteria bacterium]
MRINYSLDGLEEIHKQLIRVNEFQDAPSSYVYVQITRGAAPRTHYFPQEDVEPTVYAFARTWQRPSPERWAQGFSAMTVPDRRWSRADIKTICLLPNVLAFQDAIEAGADDAILVRDGVAIEGAHMNFWGVFDGTVVTHPTTSNILPVSPERLCFNRLTRLVSLWRSVRFRWKNSRAQMNSFSRVLRARCVPSRP